MFKFLGLLLLLINFSFYVLEHGTCSSFDADIEKCETDKSKSQQNSEASHNSESNSGSGVPIHTCGCASLFVNFAHINVINHFQSMSFGFQNIRFSVSDFKERIERPPITRS